MKYSLARSLPALLALCLLLGSLPAAAAEPLPEYRITMFLETLNGSPYTSSEDTVIGQIIKDRFNIVFDFEVMTQDWNEFVNLKLASQDFPEIALLRWDYTGANWVNGGGALQLDELFADAENFKSLNAARLPLWRMDDPTGARNLYKWTYAGGLDEAIGPRCDVMVRCDVLEKMGSPKIRSTSDYVEFLRQAVALFPTDANGNKTIGMCVPLAETWGTTMVSILAEKATYSGCAYFPAMYNCETDAFEDFLTIPAVRENFEFFNTLYREGLLDPECFTTTCNEISEKMNTAQPICVFYPTWLAPTANIALAANGLEASSYICIPIQTDGQVENGEIRHLGVWQGNSSYALTMTPATRHPERIVELMDWIASPEGLSTVTWGVEGLHWNWVDGVKTISDEYMALYKAQNDEYYRQGIGTFDFLGVPDGINPYDGAPVHFTGAAEFTREIYNDTVKKTLAAYGVDLEEQFWTGAWIESDHIDITVQQSATIFDPDSMEAIVSEQILQNRNNHISDLITAADDAQFDAAWDALISDHLALNPQVATDYINERYKTLSADYAQAMAD